MKLIHTADYYQSKGAWVLCHKFKNGGSTGKQNTPFQVKWYNNIWLTGQLP